MQYLKLDAADRERLMRSLATMPDYLREQFAALSAQEACLPGAAGAFSPLEQVWHLADLEREGFGVRIRRLRVEPAPQLPDFDGAQIARQRNYRTLSLHAGLAAFAAARHANLALLRALPAHAWTRGGTQQGAGAVSLCDMPGILLQHDRAHQREIDEWQRTRRGRPEPASDLRT